MSSSSLPNYTPSLMDSESIELAPMNQESCNTINQDSSEIRGRIMEIIQSYEEKYKMFSPMNISSKEAIFLKIQTMLSIELNIEIELLFRHDYSSFNMILAAFFCQKHALDIPQQGTTQYNSEKDLLPFCEHPLHTVMVMCFAAHSMQKMILKDDFAQTLKQDKYEHLKEHLEDLACKIINNFYLNGEGGKEIREALQADYKWTFREAERTMTPYEEYLYRKFDRSKEIMTVAYKAKAMKFLSQRPCLNLMRIRNECRKVDSSVCELHEKKQKKKKENTPNRKLWISMNWKLWIHAFFRALYIALFAYMLCKFPVYDDLDMVLKKEWKEKIPYYYVLSVLVAQVSMTIIKAVDYLEFHAFKAIQASKTKRSSKCTNLFPSFFSIGIRRNGNLLHPYFKSNKLAIWRIFLVVPLLLLESVQFMVFLLRSYKKLKSDEKFWYGGWVLIPIALELLYCALFAIATVSSLRFFHFVQSLGFFVHLFKKMWKTVGMFVLIFCAFWFVLAVIHVSISRTFMSSTNTFLYTVASQGKFEIFGEVQDDDRTGNLLNCGEFNRTIFDFFKMDYVEASCLFRSSVMPFLVFTYIFVTGILLVNLLTAQLTKEYEKESEKSRYYKGYLKFEQLTKIESKLYLPPPLSILYVATRIIIFVSTGICKTVNFFTSRCCKSSCLCSRTSKWAYDSICEIEGYPWGAVRDAQKEDPQLTEKKIKIFLMKSPDDFREKLNDVVNDILSNQDTLDEENLIKLKKSLDDFLEKETIEERDRAQSRLEHSRMEGAQSMPRNRSSLIGIRLEEEHSSDEESIPYMDSSPATPPPTRGIGGSSSFIDRDRVQISGKNLAPSYRNGSQTSR